MNRLLSFLLLSALFIQPCIAQKKKKQSEANLLANKFAEANKPYLSGFLLKELQSGQTVYELNANKSFVLGSNTKIFTLLGGLHILKDSVPSFQYNIHGDSLLIWPMGDPTFLHSEFKAQPAFEFLKNSGKNIYLC